MTGPDPAANLGKAIAVLAGIQRAAATGSLVAHGPGGGVLVFRGGALTREIGEGGSCEAPGAVVSAAPLQGDLRDRAREILTAALSSTEGPAFLAGAPDDASGPGVAAASLNAGDLILDIARAAADPDWVRSQIAPSCQIRPNTAPPSVLPRLSLGPSEGFLLSRCDGTLTLLEILAVSPLGERETLAALYGLVAAGLLVAPGVEILADASRISDASGRIIGPPPSAEPAAGGSPPPGGPAPPPAPQRRVADLDAFLKRTTAAALGTSPAGGGAAGPSSAPDRERVEKRIAECRGADHYGILGVARNADENAVRRAYYRIAKIFHPDRYRRGEFEDLLPEIEAMFAATTDAYNTLTDEKERPEYDRHLAEQAAGPRPPDADLVAQARESYQRARKHLDGEEFYDALRLLETACQMDPSKHEYWLHLGIVETKNPRWRKKAEQSLLKAIELNPSGVAAYQHLARVYKAGGLARRAAELFEKVLEWEPVNEEALQELGRKKAEEGVGRAGRLRSIFKGPKA